MPAPLGIELTPDACRIVELDSSHQDGSDTRVSDFARLPRSGVEMQLRLASLRRRPAAVVVWGLHSDHRQAIVTHGPFYRMRREAVAATRHAGVDARRMVADMAPVGQLVPGETRRPVLVALARIDDLATAMRALTSEYVRVRSIVTPALALMSLARLRHESPEPGLTEAYVALEERATAIALMRDGALVAACELEWGYQDERRHTRPREEIASRLAAAIERFLAGCGARPRAVSQICVCGGLPELRSMTVPLMEQLDVEVEPLDSLFAIDAARLPEPAREFRDCSAELRLAWAVAADWQAPIDLLRERRRRWTKTVLSQAAVAAGVATGVGLAWQVQQSQWWRSTSLVPTPVPLAERLPAATVARAVPPSGVTRPTPAPVAGSVTPAPAATPATAAPLVSDGVPAATPVTAVTALKATTPATAAGRQPATSLPSTRLKAESGAFPAPMSPAPIALPPAVQPATAPPIVKTRPDPRPSVAGAAGQPRRSAPPPPTVSPAVVEPRRPAAPELVRPPASRDAKGPPSSPSRPLPERRPVPPEATALPFDGVLGTILYAPERKLAIIDGHIVQVGDEVRGARVVDITPTAVLLRDAQGRLLRVALGR